MRKIKQTNLEEYYIMQACAVRFKGSKRILFKTESNFYKDIIILFVKNIKRILHLLYCNVELKPHVT